MSTAAPTKTKNSYEFRSEIRMPADIAQRMRELSDDHDRSFNAEMVYAMRRYIAAHAQQQADRDQDREISQRPG